jgi:hypothetical protein
MFKISSNKSDISREKKFVSIVSNLKVSMTKIWCDKKLYLNEFFV